MLYNGLNRIRVALCPSRVHKHIIIYEGKALLPVGSNGLVIYVPRVCFGAVG